MEKAGMRKGNVCGACTGALMVLGLLYGEEHKGAPEERQRSNKISDMMMTCCSLCPKHYDEF